MKLKLWDQTINSLFSCTLFTLYPRPSFYPSIHPSFLSPPRDLILFSISPSPLCIISPSHPRVICCSASLRLSLPFYTTYPLLPSIPLSPASLHLFPYPLRWCASRVLCLHQRSSVIGMGVCLRVWTWILITLTHQNTHAVTRSTQANHRIIQAQQVG